MSGGPVTPADGACGNARGNGNARPREVLRGRAFSTGVPSVLQGRQDSNLRPSVLETGALTS